MNLTTRITNQSAIDYFAYINAKKQLDDPNCSPRAGKNGKISTKKWVLGAFHTTSKLPGKISASSVPNTSAAPTVDQATETASGLEAEPRIHFDEYQIHIRAEKFKFCLVGKFPQSRPSLEQIKEWAAKEWKLEGSCAITLLDQSHVLIRLESEVDRIRVWPRNQWFVEGQPMKVFKWTPTFRPLHSEPSSAAVWISLPCLPVVFYDEDLLYRIASKVGKVLGMDDQTRNLTRTTFARVCVEVDLLKEPPRRVWIEVGKDGFWQPVDYEELPSYCTSCCKIGHVRKVCSRNKSNIIVDKYEEKVLSCSIENFTAKWRSYQTYPLFKKCVLVHSVRSRVDKDLKGRVKNKDERRYSISETNGIIKSKQVRLLGNGVQKVKFHTEVQQKTKFSIEVQKVEQEEQDKEEEAEEEEEEKEDSEEEEEDDDDSEEEEEDSEEEEEDDDDSEEEEEGDDDDDNYSDADNNDKNDDDDDDNNGNDDNDDNSGNAEAQSKHNEDNQANDPREGENNSKNQGKQSKSTRSHFRLSNAISFWKNRPKKRLGGDTTELSTKSTFPLQTVISESRKTPSVILSQSLVPKPFSFTEIKRATKDFDAARKLGEGGFGPVYKGLLNDGALVAIKRLSRGSHQGGFEFITEIEMFSRLRHKNLVALIGYCNEKNERILVYEFMSGGDLGKHLFSGHPLSWTERLRICIAAAKALDYLHTNAVIHRDVKVSNILIDGNWEAKLTDLGISRLAEAYGEETHVSTRIMGTFGYLAPEYAIYGRLSYQSDVYAFGVVMLEVLFGRSVNERRDIGPSNNIEIWRKACRKKMILEADIDSCLKDEISPRGLKKFAALATKCVSFKPSNRPRMGDVLYNLQFILKLEQQHDARKLIKTEASIA